MDEKSWQEFRDYMSGKPKGYTAELLRLCRLGLWAEKHGKPAVELFMATDGPAAFGTMEAAFEAIPKEPK